MFQPEPSEDEPGTNNVKPLPYFGAAVGSRERCPHQRRGREPLHREEAEDAHEQGRQAPVPQEAQVQGGEDAASATGESCDHVGAAAGTHRRATQALLILRSQSIYLFQVRLPQEISLA